MQRRKLVAGNWKLNGALASNRLLLDALRGGAYAGADCAVLVPYPYLAQAGEILKGSRVVWGAQDVSEHETGAFTGEVSAPMLVEFGCRFVTVGHSERRALFAEDDATVARKMAAAMKGGVTPILCVGETLAEREAGQTAAVVERQLKAVVDGPGTALFTQAVVAYEPVWAIGTGKTATPDQAQEVHGQIRALLNRWGVEAAAVPILYGGSVKASNAASLFAMPDVDGGLVGGASLVATEFLDIWRAAAEAGTR